MIVELTAEGDEVMLFDVAGDAGGRKVAVTRSGADAVPAQRGLDEAIEQAQRSASTLLRIVQDQDVDEAELRFGLRLTGEAGLFAISRVGGEAHCEVTLRWSRRPR